MDAMKNLIEILQKYNDDILETEDERNGFVAYMAEAFKRYARVKQRVDNAQEQAFEIMRRAMQNEQTDN